MTKWQKMFRYLWRVNTILILVAAGAATFGVGALLVSEVRLTASCITCHSVSSIKNDGTDGITQINNQVGPQYVPPAGWIARDFVWSLALACPNGIQACTSSK